MEKFQSRVWSPVTGHTIVECHRDRLDIPLRWKDPCSVILDAHGDLFHPDVPDEFISMVWDRMFNLSRHRFQILTKYADHFQKWTEYAAKEMRLDIAEIWPGNIAIGIFVDSQKSATRDITQFLQVPVVTRWAYINLREEIDLWFALKRCTLDTDNDGNCPIHPYGCPRLGAVICDDMGVSAHPEWLENLRRQCVITKTVFLRVVGMHTEILYQPEGK